MATVVCIAHDRGPECIPRMRGTVAKPIFTHFGILTADPTKNVTKYKKTGIIVLARWRPFLLFVIPVSTNCFADMDIMFLLPNMVVPNACVFQNTGVYENGFTMVPVYEDTIYDCGRGYYLPQGSETCTICPENSYCPGGGLVYSETGDVGLNPCPDGAVAPAGMWELAQCGRLLHIGDAVLYLRTTKQTTPSLNIDVDGDGVADYFANATTADVPLNKNTERKLRVSYGDIDYCIYDDTVSLPETTAVKE